MKWRILMALGTASLFKNKTRHALIILLALLAFCARGNAQVDTGAIVGNVTDSGGAVVPGASVTITEEGTGLTQAQNTGADGGFSFTPVKIGNYTLTVGKAGFKTSVQKHIEVTVQGHLEINPKLQVGEVAQQVEVNSSGPILDTQTSSIQQLVGQRTINDLPLNGRNAVFLAQL